MEDTLPQPVRSLQRFRVENGRCHVCGWTGRGRHEGLAAGQHGATAHRTGPNVRAQALTLHYHYGLPLSKVPAVIAAATGIRLTQSALTQTAAGLAAEGGVVHTAYQELRAAVPASAVVNTDDTGWRIGGAGAFLMGFFTPLLAVFQIRWQHQRKRHAQV
jgi:transposase